MENQRKDSAFSDHEPFEIVYNARKHSKLLKSTACKSRKNSAISLADEKQKKIKKKTRKLTDYFEGEVGSLSQMDGDLEKLEQNSENMFMQGILRFEEEKIMPEQKQKQQKEYRGEPQQEEFYFEDWEGEKGIMEGIGDEDSLGGQFKFDFFNPEKYSK